MSIVVFTGGEAPNPEITKKFFEEEENKPKYVIAADSGIETLEKYRNFFGLEFFVPNVLLGDWDSISDKGKLQKYPQKIIENFIADKDYTDTELALEKAHTFLKNHSQDVHKIILIGAGGGQRIDHLLAVYDLFATNLQPAVWICGYQFLYILSKQSESKISGLKISDTISILRSPASRTGGKITSTGLEWESDLFRKAGVPSISNRISKEFFQKNRQIEIKVEDGEFILITPYSAKVEITENSI